MAWTTLVSALELSRHLGDPGWIVYDCTHDLMKPAFGPETYAAGHIPGAIFVSVDDDLSSAKNGRNGRHPMPAPEAFAQVLGRTGFDGSQQVVIYDGQGGMPSSRLWWMLRWMGHDAVALLDGGFKGWVAAGHPVSTDVPKPVARTFVPSVREAMRVDAAFVAGQVGGSAIRLVDARAADRYRGENEVIDPKAGHIPGALNRPWGQNLGADGRFKPAGVLREEFTALFAGYGASETVHSCGSGVSACHNLLAMEIAGLAGARLYPGSWSEWIADPARPIATGPNP